MPSSNARTPRDFQWVAFWRLPAALGHEPPCRLTPRVASSTHFGWWACAHSSRTEVSLPGAPVGAPAGSRPCTHEPLFGWVRRTLSFGLVAGGHSELLHTMEVRERHARTRADILRA